MPLGNPEGPTASQWKVTVGSTDMAGDYPVTFEAVATADNPDAPEVAGIVQKFVDMVNASGSFRLLSAERTYSYSEAITPTA
jgi:hypothetical protein